MIRQSVYPVDQVLHILVRVVGGDMLKTTMILGVLAKWMDFDTYQFISRRIESANGRVANE